jgi:hypothetical protein
MDRVTDATRLSFGAGVDADGVDAASRGQPSSTVMWSPEANTKSETSIALASACSLSGVVAPP